MKNLFTIDNVINTVGGFVISSLEEGAPEGEIEFLWNMEEGSNNLLITPTSFPTGTTHWIAVVKVQGKNILRPIEGMYEAQISPTSLGNVFDLISDVSEVFSVKLVPFIEETAGRVGKEVHIDLSTLPEDIELISPPSISATKVGDTLSRTPPQYNAVPFSEQRILQGSADGVEFIEIEPFTLVPSTLEGQYVREHYTTTGFSGNIIEFTSNTIGPIEVETEDPNLTAIQPEDIEIESSFYDCESTRWFRPKIQLSSHLEGKRIRWTTTNPTTYPNDGPNIDWSGYVVPIEGEPGFYTIHMANEADHCVLSPQRQDYALFEANNPLPRERLRFAYQDASADPVNDPWSPISLPSWFIPVPTVPLPDQGEIDWRPTLLRSEAQFGVTPNVPHLDPYGIYPVDGMQWYPGIGQWSADGVKFLVGQDSGLLNLSLDQGSTIFRPSGENIRVSVCNSIKWDPNNNDRAFVVVGATEKQYNTSGHLGGIYVTEDNCKTFTPKLYLNTPGKGDNAADNFAFRGNTWYCMINKFQFNPNSHQPLSFCRSTDNGDTWVEVTTLPYSTYGTVFQLEVDPGHSTTLYMATSTGFWKSTNNGGSWTKNWMTGMPQNMYTSSFWIDPDDNNHIFCTVRNTNASQQGLWESNNGTAFTRIRAVWAHHVALGAKDSNGNRTLYLQPAGGDTPHIRLRNGTWITRSTSPGVTINFLGMQDNYFPTGGVTFDNGSQQHTWFSPHPYDPDICIYHSVTLFLRTENEGRDFVLAAGGLGGLNWRGFFINPDDPEVVSATLHDTGVLQSKTGFHTSHVIRWSGTGGFYQRMRSVMTAGSWTGRACFTFPDNPILPAAWRGRMVFGAGGSASTAGVLGYVNKDSTTILDWLGSNPTPGQSNAQGGGVGARSTGGYLPHNPRKAWLGVNVINLQNSENWYEQGGRMIFGCANDGTDTVYGFNGAGTPALLRSPDFGDNWYDFYTAGSNIINAGVYAGDVNGGDGRRMFIKTGHRNFASIFDNNGTAEVVNFNLNSLFSDLPSIPTDARISSIASDPLDIRYIYVGFENMGIPKKVFRGKFNDTFTSIEWENITHSGPINSSGIQIYTNKIDGSIHVNHNGLGLYTFPSPDDWQPLVGSFIFSGQPSNGNSLTVNGETVTFVTSGASGLQVNIGGDLTTTVSNLANVLNSSSNSNLNICTYRADGNKLFITMDAPRTNVEETFPLSAASTPNATLGRTYKPYKRKYWLRLPLLGSKLFE